MTVSIIGDDRKKSNQRFLPAPSVEILDADFLEYGVPGPLFYCEVKR